MPAADGLLRVTTTHRPLHTYRPHEISAALRLGLSGPDAIYPLDSRSFADSNFIMSRALFVKNLRFVINTPSLSSYQNTSMLTGHRSYNVTPEELFELFGKYGPIRYVAIPDMISASIY